ncbi:MAG TPA: hypothetical protein VKT82_18505 [Ktedonobacterales bacterium]|nr:hypothetical protein [Ktedonobacterales bacterium]
MKLLIFLQGTTIMHRNATGHTRAERVQQVHAQEASVRDYAAYVPVGDAVHKLCRWSEQGAEIVYLSSHKRPDDVNKDQVVLRAYGFPAGQIAFCQEGERYQDVAERVLPDILIEDDCESIGGTIEMTYPHIRPEVQASITSIVVKEFEGIDHLPDDLATLRKTGR